MFVFLDDGDEEPGFFGDVDLPDGASAAGGAAAYSLLNDGTYAATVASSANATGDWVKPASATVAQFYEAHVEVTAGTLTSGTADTWLPLSTTRTWEATSCEFTLQIREAATGIVRLTKSGIELTQVA